MHLSGFDRFVWAATFCGHIVVLLVLFVRRSRGVPFRRSQSILPTGFSLQASSILF